MTIGMLEKAAKSKKEVSTQTLKELSKRALFPWLNDALMDWAVIIGALIISGYFHNIAVYFLAILVIGNRQHALSLLGHEGTHYILSHNKKINDTMTNFFTFWPLGITVSGYRSLHNRHHHDLATDHDPELAHKTARAPQWDLPITPFKILRYAAMDLFGYSIPDFIIIVTYSKPPKKREYVPLAAYHILGNIILITLGLWWVSLMWYFCLLTSFMMFFRLRLWVEHQGSDLAHRLHLTKIEGAILAPHNAWHHWEHHNWPTIPYNKLPEVRKLTSIEPVITLKELLRFYQTCSPTTSGAALRQS